MDKQDSQRITGSGTSEPDSEDSSSAPNFEKLKLEIHVTPSKHTATPKHQSLSVHGRSTLEVPHGPVQQNQQAVQNPLARSDSSIAKSGDQVSTINQGLNPVPVISLKEDFGNVFNDNDEKHVNGLSYPKETCAEAPLPMPSDNRGIILTGSHLNQIQYDSGAPSSVKYAVGGEFPGQKQGFALNDVNVTEMPYQNFPFRDQGANVSDGTNNTPTIENAVGGEFPRQGQRPALNNVNTTEMSNQHFSLIDQQVQVSNGNHSVENAVGGESSGQEQWLASKNVHVITTEMYQPFLYRGQEVQVSNGKSSVENAVGGESSGQKQGIALKNANTTEMSHQYFPFRDQEVQASSGNLSVEHAVGGECAGQNQELATNNADTTETSHQHFLFRDQEAGVNSAILVPDILISNLSARVRGSSLDCVSPERKVPWSTRDEGLVTPPPSYFECFGISSDQLPEAPKPQGPPTPTSQQPNCGIRGTEEGDATMKHNRCPRSILERAHDIQCEVRLINEQSESRRPQEVDVETSPDHQLLAFLSCVLFWPIGLLAIYYANIANSMKAEGFYQQSIYYSKRALALSLAAIAIGTTMYLLFYMRHKVGL